MNSKKRGWMMLFIGNSKIVGSAFGLACMALVITACTNTMPMSLNSVQFSEKTLARAIAVDSVSMGLSEVGNSQLNAKVRSLAKKPLVIEISTSWYDDNFVPTESPSSWQRVMLKHNQSYIFNVHATNVQSTHYVINVRNGGS